MIGSHHHDKLWRMYGNLSTIVVETAVSDGTKDQRSLSSREAIAQLRTFWTIESRLVDSLGTISRDLGRELSLHTFLATLAPELRDMRLSPIVHDPHLHLGGVFSRHRVQSAEFSRHHQQTALEWVRHESGEEGHVFMFDPAAYEFLRHDPELGRAYFREDPSAVRLHGIPAELLMIGLRSVSGRLYVAPITGDLDSVLMLRTRVAIISDPRSGVAEAVSKLRSAIRQCSASDQIPLAILNLAGVTIQNMMRKDRHAASAGLYDRDAESRIPLLWPELAARTNGILSDLQIPGIPESLGEIVGGRATWFDAASYWRDWGKKEMSL
jgi:hypothetical protein